MTAPSKGTAYLGCFPKSSVSKPLLSPPQRARHHGPSRRHLYKGHLTRLPTSHQCSRKSRLFFPFNFAHATPPHPPDPLGAFAVLNPAPSHSLQSPARPPLSTPPPTSLLATLFSHRSFFWTTSSSLQGPGLTLLLRFQLLRKSFLKVKSLITLIKVTKNSNL